MKSSFPCQQMLAVNKCNFAKEMGTPSLSAILTWTVTATKDKPIAMGWEPDLLFKVDVIRRQASDTTVIVAIFHFRGMWTETKGGRLQNYHHNLSLALCVILQPF